MIMNITLLKRSLITSVVVGSILIILNQWDHLLNGPYNLRLLSKVILTPFVPFCVSYLSGFWAMKSIQKKLDLLDEIAKGDLTIQFDPSSTDQTNTALNKHLGQLRQDFETYFHIAYGLLTHSEELSLTGRKIQDIIQSCKDGFEKMTQNFQSFLEQNQKVNESLETSFTQTEKISLNSNDNFETLKSLQKLLLDVEKKMELQAKSMSKIDEFSGLISEIAFQSKILAFNASVEAQRAGEAGKGFSVVSQEIKKLSDLTNQEAGHIKTETEQILDQNDQLINSFKLSLTKMKTGMEKTLEVKELVDNQIGQFHAIRENIQGNNIKTNESDENLKSIVNEFSLLPLVSEQNMNLAQSLGHSAQMLRAGIKNYQVGFEARPQDVLEFMQTQIIGEIETEKKIKIEYQFHKEAKQTKRPKDVYQKLTLLIHKLGFDSAISIISGEDIWPSDVITLAGELKKSLNNGVQKDLSPSYLTWKNEFPSVQIYPDDVYSLLDQVITQLR